MNLLMKLASPRLVALLLVLAALAALAWRRREEAAGRYRAWRYPPQGAASPLGREILEGVERAEARQIVREHRRLMALLDDSHEEGFDVSDLRARAGQALALNVSGRRRRALEAMASIEMEVPRRKVQYIPVDEPQEEQRRRER